MDKEAETVRFSEFFEKNLKKLTFVLQLFLIYKKKPQRWRISCAVKSSNSFFSVTVKAERDHILFTKYVLLQAFLKCVENYAVLNKNVENNSVFI